LQQSRSAEVIVAPGNTQAATGNAASITARAETATLINSFNTTSLSTTDGMTQQAGKGFTLPPVTRIGQRWLRFSATRRQKRTESGLSESNSNRSPSPSSWPGTDRISQKNSGLKRTGKFCQKES